MEALSLDYVRFGQIPLGIVVFCLVSDDGLWGVKVLVRWEGLNL